MTVKGIEKEKKMMRNLKRKIILVFLAAAAICSMGLTMTVPAAQENEEGFCRIGSALVYIEDGKRVRDTWIRDDDAKYYFGKNGAAAVGLVKNHNRWYLFDKAGRLAAGQDCRMLTVDGERYLPTRRGIRSAAGCYTTAIFIMPGAKKAVSRSSGMTRLTGFSSTRWAGLWRAQIAI